MATFGIARVVGLPHPPLQGVKLIAGRGPGDPASGRPSR
jgi:hypothetical protein